MITATRRIQFCCGHRVVNHESKCANLHGHNYVAYITAVAKEPVNPLDELGRVIDFSVLKEKVGGWIDQVWDHTLVINSEDDMIMPVIDKLTKNKKPHIVDFNPTAENMADYLLRVVSPSVLLNTGVKVVKIRLYETENCYADAILEGYNV